MGMVTMFRDVENQRALSGSDFEGGWEWGRNSQDRFQLGMKWNLERTRGYHYGMNFL